MNHPNLSNEINRNIAQSEIEGGVFLKNLTDGAILNVQTRNTLYRVRKIDADNYTISGHDRFCPVETPCRISGSTWGGSMLKMGFVGRGMQMEFLVKGFPTLTTSTIQDITEKDPGAR